MTTPALPASESPEPNSPESPRRSGSRASVIVTVILGVIILIPSMAGFVAKFIELIAVVQGDGEGLFAITPIINYLFASLGFLCMLIWATGHGMFTDIEKPKYTMLEQEERLDAGRR